MASALRDVGGPDAKTLPLRTALAGSAASQPLALALAARLARTGGGADNASARRLDGRRAACGYLVARTSQRRHGRLTARSGARAAPTPLSRARSQRLHPVRDHRDGVRRKDEKSVFAVCNWTDGSIDMLSGGEADPAAK